jgi:hypothetical protein
MQSIKNGNVQGKNVGNAIIAKIKKAGILPQVK